MLWTIVMWIITGLFIAAFAIPVIALIAFGASIAYYASGENYDSIKASIHRAGMRHSYKKASGPVCQWKPPEPGHAR